METHGQQQVNRAKMQLRVELLRSRDGVILEPSAYVSFILGAPTPSLGRFSLINRILELTCSILPRRAVHTPCCRGSSAVRIMCGIESLTVAMLLVRKGNEAWTIPRLMDVLKNVE